MAYKTTYTDKNGKTNDGYIINGQTYTDAAGTTRVPVGATVQTKGGTYTMTDGGGVATYPTAKNDFKTSMGNATQSYSDYANSQINAYKGAGKARESAINSATQAAVRALNQQKTAAGLAYEDANKGAYENYLAAANPYGAAAEQRAALGLDNSGFAESSQIKLASAYQGQLGENQRARDKALSEIEVQIAQARASGQYELANALEAQAQTALDAGMQVGGNVLNANQNMYGTVYSADQAAQSAAQQQSQFNQQAEQEESHFERTLTAQKEQERAELALQWISAGVSPSFAAESLGIPQADINALVNAVRAANAPKVSSGGGGSRSSGGGSGGNASDNPYYEMIYQEIYNSGVTPEEFIGQRGSNLGLSSAKDKQAVVMGYNNWLNRNAANIAATNAATSAAPPITQDEERKKVENALLYQNFVQNNPFLKR